MILLQQKQLSLGYLKNLTVLTAKDRNRLSRVQYLSNHKVYMNSKIMETLLQRLGCTMKLQNC